MLSYHIYRPLSFQGVQDFQIFVNFKMEHLEHWRLYNKSKLQHFVQRKLIKFLQSNIQHARNLLLFCIT